MSEWNYDFLVGDISENIAGLVYGKRVDPRHWPSNNGHHGRCYCNQHDLFGMWFLPRFKEYAKEIGSIEIPKISVRQKDRSKYQET